MSDFFLGQIMLTGFGFAPRGFAQCNGQLLPISQNAALFSLLGTIYGGNGTTTFSLPDLRGRTPVGFGNGFDGSSYTLGEVVGTEAVTLTQGQLPAHTHLLGAVTQNGTARSPTNALYGAAAGEALYGPNGNAVALAAGQVQPTGGGQPHSNMQPYGTINFNIALTGIYPSRS